MFRVIASVLLLSGATRSQESPGVNSAGAGADSGPLLESSRCAFSTSETLVPGLAVDREWDTGIGEPLIELILEYLGLMEEVLIPHEVLPGYIVSRSLRGCWVFGELTPWVEYVDEIGRGLSGDDKLVLESLIGNRLAETMCVSGNYQLIGRAQCLKNMVESLGEQGMNWVGQLKEDTLQSVVARVNKIIDDSVIGEPGDPDTMTGRFVCKETGLSRIWMGLVEEIEDLMTGMGQNILALDFKRTHKVSADDHIVDSLFLMIREAYELKGGKGRSWDEEAKRFYLKFWPKPRNSRSGLLSYIFTDSHKTLSNVLQTANTNLKNINILDREIRGLTWGLNKTMMELITLKQALTLSKVEADQNIKRLIIFREMSAFTAKIQSEVLARQNLLYNIYNHVGVINGVAREKFDKILSGLSDEKSCGMDGEGTFSCQRGAGVLYRKGNRFVLTNRVRKLEIKEVSLAKCLMDSDGLVFIGNGEIFVKDSSFFHSNKLTVPVTCVTHMNDGQYACEMYYAQANDDSRPDMLGENLFYLVQEGGVYIQSQGGSEQITDARGHVTFVHNKPVWVPESEFPIQNRENSIEFESLMSKSPGRGNSHHISLDYNRERNFQYGKYMMQNKNKLLNTGVQYIYRSFSHLFKNNKAVRAVSIAALVSSGVMILIFMSIIIFCCSRSREGSRRYLKYRQVTKPTRTGREEVVESRPLPPTAPEAVAVFTEEEEEHPDSERGRSVKTSTVTGRTGLRIRSSSAKARFDRILKR